MRQRFKRKCWIRGGGFCRDNHPYTFDTMTNLALTYRWQGRYVEAAKIQENVLGREDNDIGRRAS